MSGPAVELRNVSKRFGADGRPVLDRVSFRVEPGETLVLLGSSGAGKTTALRTINRLVEPDEGEVEVEGRDIRSWDPIRLRRRTGYVIQDVGLLPHLSVAENVELVPKLEGWSPERRSERGRERLAFVGLAPERFAHKRPKELSGGERQGGGGGRAPEAMKLGDRIGVMHAGRLLQLGPPSEILGRPADDFVAELVRLESA